MTSLTLKIVSIQFACFLISTAFDATLWGLQRFDMLNAIDIPSVVIRTVLTFAIVKSADELAGLAWITLGVTSANCLSKIICCFIACPQLRFGKKYLNRFSLYELLGYGSWNLIGSVARVTRRQLSPLIIGSLLGLAFVVPFSAADRLLGLVAAALSAVTGVLTPYSTVLHATGQPERQRQLFVIGGRHSGALAVFLIAFFLVLGGPLLTLWIHSPLIDAYNLLAILAMGELLPSTQFVTNGILQATARHRALSAFALIETLTVSILAFVLIPIYGLIGAGLAIAIPAFLTRGIATTIHGCRVVGVPIVSYLIQVMMPSLLCIVAPCTIVLLLSAWQPATTWPMFLGYSIIFAIGFGLCYAAILSNKKLKRTFRLNVEQNLTLRIAP